MPTNVAEILNAQIGAKRAPTGSYEVPCAKVDSFPEFSFHFGGKAYPLKGTDYILEIQGVCFSSFVGVDFSGSGSQWVVGENLTNAVVHRSLNRKFFLKLGAVFLRKYYTVFDAGRAVIGFATLV